MKRTSQILACLILVVTSQADAQESLFSRFNPAKVISRTDRTEPRNPPTKDEIAARLEKMGISRDQIDE